MEAFAEGAVRQDHEVGDERNARLEGQMGTRCWGPWMLGECLGEALGGQGRVQSRART